jgi:hypothetical protein
LQNKARSEVKRQHAAEEKANQRALAEQHALDTQEVVHADIVATIGRRAREVALASGATMEQALEIEEKATAEAEASMADVSATRD